MDKNKAAVELGKRGGDTTKSKYGTEHFKEMGRKSGEARRKKKKKTLDKR